MAAVAGRLYLANGRPDALSGTPRAGFIDRWIYVFMAAWFIAIVLAGFAPDSLMKIALVRAGERPPFPLVMHLHAVLMGSFLLLLLAQTWLMATGRAEYHMRLGLAAFVLAPALVVVGFILAPTMYLETWNAFQSAPPEARPKLQAILSRKEDVLLLQIRNGVLFSTFLVIGLLARGRNAGLHKRMMILATAPPIAAGIDRIPWLPTTMPASAVSLDLFVLLAISPMFVLDVIRNRSIHRAYWIWFAISLPITVALDAIWDAPWWHTAARQIMGA